MTTPYISVNLQSKGVILNNAHYCHYGVKMSLLLDSKQLSAKNKICPLEKAVNAISGKWKIPIIWHIQQGKKRPSELLREIENVDRRVLHQHLSEMVAAGLLIKNSFNELPPRVEYDLTDTGQLLVEILWDLNEWGKKL